MTQGPEVQPPQTESPQVILTRVNQAASQLNHAGLSGEHRRQVVDTVFRGVIALHNQGQIAGDPAVRDSLKEQVFNADSAHKVLADTLVTNIEKLNADGNTPLTVKSLLQLSFFLGINDQSKFPDLAARLEAISGGGGPEGPRRPEVGDKEWETSPERRRAIIQEIYRLEAIDSYREKYRIKTGLMSETNNRIYKETNLPYLDQLYLDLQDYVRKARRVRKGSIQWDEESAYRLEFVVKKGEDIKEVMKMRREAMERRLNVQKTTFEEINVTVEKFWKSELELGEEGMPGGTGEAVFKAEELLKKPDGATAYSIDELVAIYDDPNKEEENRNSAREGLLIYLRQAKNAGLLKEVDVRLTSIFREVVSGKVTSTETEKALDEGLARTRKRAESEYKGKRRGHPELEQFKGIEKVYIDWAEERFAKTLTHQKQEGYGMGEYVLGMGEQAKRGNPKETYWRTGSWPEYYTVIARTPEEFRVATRAFLRMIKNRALGLSPEKLLPHFENFAKALGQAGNSPDVSAGVTPDFMTELRQEFEGLSYIYGAWYTNESYDPEKYHQFMMALALHEGPQRMVALARSGDGQVAAFLKMLDDDPRTRAYYLSGGSRGQIGNDTVTQNVFQEEYIEMLIEEGMGIRLKDYDPFSPELNGNTSEAVQARRARMLELGSIEEELRNIEEEVRTGKERRQLGDDEMKIYNAYTHNRKLIGVHMSDERFRSLYEGFQFDKAKTCNVANANIRNYEEFKDLDLKALPERLRRSVMLGGVQLRLQKIREGIANKSIKLEPGQKASDLLTLHQKEIYKFAYDEAKANLDVALQIVGALGEKARKGGGLYFVDRNSFVKAYETDWSNLDRLSFDQLSEDQKIGRLLSHIRDGKEVFTEEEAGFYKRLSPEKRADHVDNIPTDQAAAFVHYAKNKIKILYANSPAKIRQAAVNKIRAYAIEQIQENGFDAKLVLTKVLFDLRDPNSATYGNVLNSPAEELVLHKVKFDADDNPIGLNQETEEVIRFHEALKSDLSLHTSNSYWAYQQENRHQLTEPDVIAIAKRIRAGVLVGVGARPGDKEDMLATQLLILDPTLKRLKKLPTDRQNREVMIFDAAVDESNQGHWRIERELARAFLPDNGDANRIKMGYNREDFGGFSRYVIATKAYVAAHPKRFSRRFAAEIAEMPMHVTSYPDKLGRMGVLGLIEMHADEIGEIAGQRVASQFSITKYVNEMRYGWMMFGALFGYIDEKGVSIEGLYEKPTNNADQLAQHYEDLNKARNYADSENKFFYALLETFGRLDRVLKLMRVMESDTNNAQGALKVDDKDVFLKDGRFNREIAVEGNRNTGASRHSQREFFDAFVNWLKDEKPGGGALAYPSEARFYKHLDDQLWHFDKDGKKIMDKNLDGSERTWRDWLFDKMCR